MEKPEAEREPFRVRHGIFYWFLPLISLGGTVAVHAVAGAGIPDQVYYGAPALGFCFTILCWWWASRMRRQLEDELEARSDLLGRSRIFLQNLVDSSPDAIVLADLAGVVTFASKSAELILGYETGELIGREASQFYSGGMEAARRLRLRLLEAQGRLSGERVTLLHREGRVVPVSLSATFLEGDDGHPIGIMGVFQDITDRVDLEEKELQAERLRLLGECVAGIAHELNNPLTGVIGYLQLAAKGDISPDLKAAVDKAATEAGRMANTIRSLLTFVRRHEPERSPTDLAELAGQVVSFQGYHLAAIDISLEVVADEMPRALVDPHQIRQVLLNLVKNAADAIEEMGRPGHIVIRIAREKGVFRIEVADDGPGVPGDLSGRIFEDFFTTKAVGRGSGLGLSICRQIVAAHGGTIRHVKRSSPGAVFRVLLPVPASQAAEEEGAGPASLPEGLDVLVVDDEEAVRDYISEVLGEEGLSVHTAPDGTAALEHVARRAVDLVFVDMTMPDMSGEECGARMVEICPELAPRLIYMSGDRRRPAARALFLLKPMDPEEIVAVAARALEAAGCAAPSD